MIRLRPFEDIEPATLAKYQRARQCRDLKKLAAMLPAWIKAELSRAHSRPNAEFSLSELEFRPGAPAKLKNLLTTQSKEKPPIPDYSDIQKAISGGMSETEAYLFAYAQRRSLVHIPPVFLSEVQK
jgi:hypothetical protein